jgi:hypothetical protein
VTQRKVRVLRHVRAFSEMPKEKLEEISHFFIETKYKKGHVFYADDDETLHVLGAGGASICVPTLVARVPGEASDVHSAADRPLPAGTTRHSRLSSMSFSTPRAQPSATSPSSSPSLSPSLSSPASPPPQMGGGSAKWPPTPGSGLRPPTPGSSGARLKPLGAMGLGRLKLPSPEPTARSSIKTASLKHLKWAPPQVLYTLNPKP